MLMQKAAVVVIKEVGSAMYSVLLKHMINESYISQEPAALGGRPVSLCSNRHRYRLRLMELI